MSLLDRFLNWFSTTTMWVKFARHWLGYFTFRVFGYTRFPMDQYFAIKDTFDKAPDGIFGFVCADTQCLAYRINHWLTGCTWSHAGLIRKHGDHLYAWHMKGNGLVCWHLLDVLKQCDRFALGRLAIEGDNIKIANDRFDTICSDPLVPYDYRLEIPQDVIQWLETGKPLDESDKERLQKLTIYCSEFAYVIGAGLCEPDLAPHVVHGRKVFEPDDLYDAMQGLFDRRMA